MKQDICSPSWFSDFRKSRLWRFMDHVIKKAILLAVQQRQVNLNILEHGKGLIQMQNILQESCYSGIGNCLH